MKKAFLINAIKHAARQLLLMALFAVSLQAAPGHNQDVLDREVTLNIKEKKLEYVLNKIEEQTKITFVFSPKLIQSSRLVTISKSKEKLSVVLNELSSYLHLDYEVAGDKVILKRQLPDKATAETDNNPPAIEPVPITGKITNAKGDPLSGVSIVVRNKGGGTSTNANGVFTINADEGDVLVVSYIGFKTQEITIGGQHQLTIRLEDAIAELTTVVVGSRSLRPRSNVESPVPVDVISSKDLLATGQIEPTQQIQYTAPSFVSNHQTVADGTDHIDPASLRGLGPDQVLVLVNGKRRYNQALVNINGTVGKGSVGTDLNAIPASSIERIEVLRDGAASQYGSDAIAGVINVVLKKKTGTQVFAHAGQQYAGDGANLQLGINEGFKLGKKGGVLNLTGEVRHRNPTNRAGNYLGTVYNANATIDDAMIAQKGGWDRSNNMFIGNSRQLNAYGEANLELPISTKSKFYAMGMYSYRKGKAAGFYRYPKQTTQVVADLYPRGFLPYIGSEIQDRSLMAGFKGKTAGAWNWDVSSTYGGNQFRFDVTNSNNASMGDASPTSFYCGKLAFQQSTTNVDFSKDFGSQLNLSSFNVALGAEMRVDMFKISPGQEESWKNYDPNGGKAGGAQVFPGYQPANAVNENRNVLSTYVDVESDITEKFLVNVAGRFEHYSDFGSALAGKLALRYKILDALAIRGAISNGFRAPSIHQYFFNNTSTQFQLINGTLTPSNTLTVRNSDPIAKALGIPDLKEETSVNYSLGITAKPGRNTSLTVDAYRIDIKNRILLAGPFKRTTAGTSIVDQVLNNAGIGTDVQVVQAFANFVDTKTQGVDIIFSVSPQINTGNLDITLAANFNETKIQKIKGTDKIPAKPDSVGNYFYFDRAEQSRVEKANPKNKVSLSANYQYKKFGLLARATRFGKVSSLNADPRLDETYDPKVVTDASISYSILPQVRVTIGANNLFDVYPDKLKWFRDGTGDKTNIYYGNTSDGRFVYSRNATQFGMNGGYYYVSLSANF
ncbi:TonB-dependent receptor [Niastella koreensis]|uniref:TonB-dependent receptor n=2 Tax=Niastella koreensis TaxID=354356 RepID=G8TR44_NIAKG|nr:TonB-dependent receptor [Niastella koreensis]AEV98958.1 TonB-dependent receptor [Niastella koreensis GR20-10]OQP43881.1 TonB-dependent receptor [Niastella koreensis]